MVCRLAWEMPVIGENAAAAATPPQSPSRTLLRTSARGDSPLLGGGAFSTATLQNHKRPFSQHQRS